MSEEQFGERGSNQQWAPDKLIEYPAVFVWPPNPLGLMRYILAVPGYIFPWHLAYAVMGVLVWLYLTPPMETMQSFAISWVAYIFARNIVMITVIYGATHLWLYTFKRQGTEFKYNGRWPAKGSGVFLFKSQHVDNLIWTYLSGVPIWTAFEVVTLWLFANGYIPYISFEEHPFYFIALFALVPLWRELHFYLIHRLIHARALYQLVHKTHHNNVNPGPFSGLSMHPIEHLLYFSCIAVHWIVPSHPVHMFFNLMHAGYSPLAGHAGFYKFKIGKNRYMDATGYLHYLHHKFFECNYGGGSIPFDKWFGTFHDGSKEAELRMKARLRERGKQLAEQRAKRAQAKSN